MLARYRSSPEIDFARQLVGEIAYGSVVEGETVVEYVNRRLDSELELDHLWVHREVRHQRTV
jgi:hypothetical protein